MKLTKVSLFELDFPDALFLVHSCSSVHKSYCPGCSQGHLAHQCRLFLTEGTRSQIFQGKSMATKFANRNRSKANTKFHLILQFCQSDTATINKSKLNLASPTINLSIPLALSIENTIPSNIVQPNVINLFSPCDSDRTIGADTNYSQSFFGDKFNW